MRRVRDSLLTDGLPVWTDETLNPGTRSWRKEIEKALEDADCLVVILSPGSKNSEWVTAEMDYAEAHDKRIFPVLAVGDVKTAIPFGYITAQWVDIRDKAQYEPEIQKLIFTVRAHMGLETLAREQQTHMADTDTQLRRPNPPETTPTVNPRVFPDSVAKAIMVLQNRENKWWRRVDALTRLGDLRDAAALPVLQAYLTDKDVDVQRAAEKAIEMINQGTKLSSEPPRPTFLPDEKPPATSDIVKKSVKMVVTGSSAALRREFIQAISEIEVVSNDRRVRLENERATVAMDYGQISVDSDLVIYLFGSPGEREFAYVWEALTEGMLGFVVLIDGNQPSSFREAKGILENYMAHSPVPFVIAVDASTDDAWQPNDVRIALRLPEYVKVLPCVVSDHQSVKNVLLELSYLIFDASDWTGAAAPVADGTQKRLALVVEDDTEVGQLVFLTLTQHGVDAYHVTNGQLALHYLETHKPDLIILDIAMPGMSGWDLLEIMKANFPDWRCPVIVLTAFDDSANMMIGKLQDRVVRYLNKPFDPAVLMQAVNQALG